MPATRSSMLWFVIVGCLCLNVVAVPPEQQNLGREQRVEYTPESNEIMRIWVAFVDQGDGMVIQLPKRYNYDPDANDGENDSYEVVDIVVDGGSNSDPELMFQFMDKLYDYYPVKLEHIILSHHDNDHVSGLTHLLNRSEFQGEVVYHNGLASYKPGSRGFPTSGTIPNAVYSTSSQGLQRCMAMLRTDGTTFQKSYLIDDLDELEDAIDDYELHGIYYNFAYAVTQDEVKHFPRAHEESEFVEEYEQRCRARTFSDIDFEVLWPRETPRKYGSSSSMWGETINGNSVTFRLRYRDFEMLFTGDHNVHSEEDILNRLAQNNELHKLKCDVLKVPHHGSKHNKAEFLEATDAVVSVASMGVQGFKSKKWKGNSAWQHPNTDVITSLGGFDRVYHTFIHERSFSWETLEDEDDHRQMTEPRHLLIETDGRWFRIVEIVPGEFSGPSDIPGVHSTEQGDGTRWVKASS